MNYYHKLINAIKNNNIDISSCDVFVETGLYIGETISDLYYNNYFENISNVYSIEIKKEFIEDCLKKFHFLGGEKFHLIHGDSSIELYNITKNHSDQKLFFWLDAHFSGQGTGLSERYGECPIIYELNSIESLNKKPIILIDDVSLFGQNNWPLVNEVEKKIMSSKFGFEVIFDEKLEILIAK
jgi:hypothetical protein